VLIPPEPTAQASVAERDQIPFKNPTSLGQLTDVHVVPFQRKLWFIPAAQMSLLELAASDGKGPGTGEGLQALPFQWLSSAGAATQKSWAEVPVIEKNESELSGGVMAVQ
jgi:hypothetical protein